MLESLKDIFRRKEWKPIASEHIPKSAMYVSSSFLGMGGSGRYVHRTELGRVTYSPAYYAMDGHLLGPHL